MVHCECHVRRYDALGILCSGGVQPGGIDGGEGLTLIKRTLSFLKKHNESSPSLLKWNS